MLLIAVALCVACVDYCLLGLTYSCGRNKKMVSRSLGSRLHSRYVKQRLSGFLLITAAAVISQLFSRRKISNIFCFQLLKCEDVLLLINFGVIFC